MEKIENLIIVRNIFYKCFLFGILFLIMAALLYLPCKCAVANLYRMGFGISAETYYDMWVSFVGLIKTILIFLFLVPALAIHSVAHDCRKKHKSTEPPISTII